MDQPYTGPNLGPLQRTAPPQSDDWSAFPEATQGKPPADDWSAFPEAGAVTAGGLAKAGGVGVAKGAIGLAGLPGDAAQLLEKGVNWVSSKLPEIPETGLGKFLREETAKVGPGAASGARGDLPGSYELPTSHDIQGQVEKVTGPFRKPQNQAERDAETAGEFLPSALAGPGGLVRKTITQAAIPAAATITAGRLSDQNPYVKALAGFVGGVGAGALAGPGSAERVLRSKIPNSVTEQDITRAGQLIEHAQARGVGLTWPEALSRVTGQPVLTDMMRVLESHPQTRPQMSEFFARRPEQVQNAATHEFNYLGGQSPNPSTIGPQAAEAATNTIEGVRAAINRATRPSYDAAAQVLVPQAVHARAMADPLFAEALHEVRNNPAISRLIGAQSDRSIEVYDAVKQVLEQRGRNLAQPTNPNASQKAAFSHNSLAADVRGTGIDAERASVNGPGHYERALGEQTRLREQYLNPLLAGPLGKLADAPDTARAISALFPTGEHLIPNGQREIGDAVRALVHRRPAVAEQLVRAHVEMVFNQAAKDLQGGANQFAGAKFVKDLVGNSQQRENLRAAVEALPNGAARWEGLNQVLDVMAATGTRQPKGSLTAFNALEVPSMSSAGLASLAAKGASPGLYWRAATEAFQSWSLGRNLDQFARLITDPRSGDALRQIIRIPAGSDRAVLTLGRLIMQIGATTTEQRSKQPRSDERRANP